MGKYIDRDKLIMEGWSLQRTYRKDAATMVCEMKKPEDFQAADVRPVVRGHWEERIVEDRENDPVGLFRRRWYCSVCGEWQTYGKTRYCPNCGAKMEGDK